MLSLESREPLALPSRFFLAPINPGLAEAGTPTPRFSRFFRSRAGLGTGICYVGNVALAPDLTSNSATVVLTDRDARAWSELAQGIREAGSVPGIQLACGASSPTPTRSWFSSPTAYVESAQAQILAMSTADLSALASLFVSKARMAVRAGFLVVQIHAAHGYLLSKLLSRKINLRRDRFGADPLHMLRLIVTGIRESCPAVTLDVRVSRLEGLEDGEEDRYRRNLILEVATLDVDMISLTNGVYDVTKRLIYPPSAWGHAPFVPSAIPYCLAVPDKLWNVCGNIWNPALLNVRTLPANLTFSLARALIADPTLLSRDWSPNQGPLCDRCDRCHYYSLGSREIACPRNPGL